MEINDKYKPKNDVEIWIRDTYAIWSMANFNAFINFCGTEFNLENANDCKAWLSRDWDVETQEELIELAGRLCDFVNESSSVLEQMKTRDIDNYNETLDFVAWDLCRGTQVLGMGFVSELIDRETMVEESSKIAYFMQKYFTSWEDLSQHYLNGYEAWANDTFPPEQAVVNIQMRKMMYEGLKMHPMGPYKIDWNLHIYDLPEFTIIENVLLGNKSEATKSCILKSYNGNATHVVVPDGVIEIHENAFENNTTIQEVTLPDTVIIIGEQAFANCSALSKINLPESVIEIGEACFWGCKSLKHITLPSNLQELKTSALGGNGLVSCTIPEGITHLMTTFYKCLYLKEVTLPKNLKYIGESSFQYCAQLTKIVIPDSVEYIGNDAFADCSNLEVLLCENMQFRFESDSFKNSPLENMFADVNNKSEDSLYGYVIEGNELIEFTDFKAEEVIIPNEVKFIHGEAFKDKTKIKKVVIHDNVRIINEKAFAGCTSLEEIIFNKSDIFVIGENAFIETPWYENLNEEFNIICDKFLIKYTGNDEHVTIPEGVTDIVAPAFSENLVGVTLPESLESIGAYAFAGCKNLKSIEMHDDVEEIGKFAFHECTSLESAVLPEYLETLEQHIFSGCTALKEVKLPKEVEEIEHLVFKDTPFWDSLTDEFTIIAGQLLKYNGKGEAVIPDTVVNIAGTAFADNNDLTSVIISDTVEKIGVSAFINCKNLEQVTFGKSVNEICTSAFLGTGLKSLKLPDTLVEITGYSFAFCKELEHLEISNSVKIIENQGFAYCEKLTELTIPETLDIIESGAFGNCILLEKINLLNEDAVIIPMAFADTKISQEEQEKLSEKYHDYVEYTKNRSEDNEIKQATLLAGVTDLNHIIQYVAEGLVDALLNVSQEENQVIFELQDNSNFILTIPEIVYNQEAFARVKTDLITAYGGIEAKNEEVQRGVINLLSGINAMFVFSFEELGIMQRTRFLFDTIFHTANRSLGLILSEGVLFNGNGEKVLDLDGNSSVDEFKPLVSAESLGIEQEEPTSEDDTRYLISREFIKEQGIPVMEEFMALSLRKSSVKLRTIEEICGRALALYTVGIYSECLRDDEEDSEAIIETITTIYNSDEYFSELEEEFVEDDEVSEQSIIQFSWSYECVGILLWALGLYDTNNLPNEIYNVEKLTQIIQEHENLDELISQAELRSTDELLQMQDLYMRYHWACIEARINDEEPAGGMITGSVMERHKALNWLLTEIFGDNWDDIQTPA